MNLKKLMYYNSFILIITFIILYLMITPIYPHLIKDPIHIIINLPIFTVLIILPEIKMPIGKRSCAYFFSLIILSILIAIISLISFSSSHLHIVLAILSISLYLSSISIGTTTFFIGKYLSSLSIEDCYQLREEFTGSSLSRNMRCYIPLALAVFLLSISLHFTKINISGIIYLSVFSLFLIIMGVYISSYISTYSKEELIKLLENIDDPYIFNTIKIYTPDEIGNFILKIISIGKEIETMRKTINTSMKKLSEMSETLVNKFSNLSKYIDKNSKVIEEAMNIATQFQQLYDEMFDSIKDMYGQLEYNYQHIQKTLNSYTDIKEVLEGIKKTTDDAILYTKAIEEMRSQMSMIIETFNEISSHIKILSINAEIEASDAGEYGRRFSVIASEIRDLSEKSSELSNNVHQSLTDISSRIIQLTEGIEKVGENLSKSNTIIQEISQSAQTSLDALTYIQSLAEVLNGKILQVTNMNEKYTSNMEKALEFLYAITNELSILEEYLNDTRINLNSLTKGNNNESTNRDI